MAEHFTDMTAAMEHRAAWATREHLRTADALLSYFVRPSSRPGPGGLFTRSLGSTGTQRWRSRLHQPHARPRWSGRTNFAVVNVANVFFMLLNDAQQVTVALMSGEYLRNKAADVAAGTCKPDDARRTVMERPRRQSLPNFASRPRGGRARPHSHGGGQRARRRTLVHGDIGPRSCGRSGPEGGDKGTGTISCVSHQAPRSGPRAGRCRRR